MPDLMSAALFERNGHLLVVHRKADHPPFAGQWLVPMTVVREDEAAEDALRRHLAADFGIGLGGESFAETVYLVDPDGERRFVANVFRAAAGAGPMQFNASGEYDDARWVAPDELEQLWMPPDLREPLVRVLRTPASPVKLDWGPPEAAAAGEAIPLAESGTQAVSESAEAPDNRAGWDAVSASYQEERYGERNPGALMWSWRASEDDLHVLDDVRGQRALVLGCGGGQDVIALAKMGAVAVGIDHSTEQIAYAKKLAAKAAAENASFVEGSVEDLSRFDDASFELVVSIHVLDYVERSDLALAEAARVLKGSGVFAMAVKHPFDLVVDGGPPYVVYKPYWDNHVDWGWTFRKSDARFRTHLRTMAQWFDLLTSAGFVIERLIEPREDVLPRVMEDTLDDGWLRLLPYTLVVKARKR